MPDSSDKLARQLFALGSELRRKRREEPTAAVTPTTIQELIERCRGHHRTPTHPTFACAECDDTGWVVSGPPSDSRRRAATPCACRTRVKVAAVLGMDPRFETATLANYRVHSDNAHAVDAGREWLDGDHNHLFFFGDVGRGKSRLAATLLNEAAHRGSAGAWISVPAMVDALQRSIDDATRKPAAQELRRRAETSPVLVLDDIAGGERGSDYTRGLLTILIERRFGRGLRTILTSNLSLGRLSEFYVDKRISSRLAGACEVVQVEGVDERVRQRTPTRQIQIVKPSS